jgi:cysteinyl-tRNA synthetase
VPLALYNTLTRRKEPFAPLDAANVRMYVCGPTVYDFAHIGNARPVIVFDVLYRLLRHLYGTEHVRYVRNITDIDDKIIAAAKENDERIETLTQRTTRTFQDDAAALGALKPDVEPRATEHLAPMIAMIERLIAAGHAYAAEGHVLFAVSSMPDYGKLSRRSRDEMIAGARVEIAPYKRDPADFVLWKPSTPDQPGWVSPWGRGRPGWHIECSAMSETYLGETFDIHGGGLDLIFPHHENEIAQSVCSHRGAPFARYWLHNAFVIVEGAKMSKSLGNFRTIRDVLSEAPGEAARYAMLKTHYHQPLDWTSEGLREAKASLDRWYRLLKSSDESLSQSQLDMDVLNPYDVPPDVMAALEDDLNTPQAIVRMNMEADEAFRAQRDGNHADLRFHAGALRAAGQLIGLLGNKPENWLKGVASPAQEIEGVASPAQETPFFGAVWEVPQRPQWSPGTTISGPPLPLLQAEIERKRIDDLVWQRSEARKIKNFAEADKIRVQLAAEGIVLEDKPDGTTDWRRN